ncbi:nucleoside-diphosphate kinase [Ramlibacter tataouinensis]|uniref:Uncharacterized protein n=1 Tax=Ramlibacter tataouinensis (strain ATCC BAA-407 / DSM 14655 / LMG 21543 / TTB310) TaxID=365046 RepID=F5XXB6_RAMTT|nr:nucleoside-diphosphate kinase [Ramlibacter tataouinensis]AEG94251.1 hypothetical protein Rta_31410 [Ramlibacter tataouinensis TTB310]
MTQGLEYASALPMLTVQERKAELYASEFAADECWSALLETHGPRIPDFVYGHTFLVIKPEAIARRLTRVALDFVTRHGYIPVGHTPVAIGRADANAIWRFQWNAATLDRVRLTHRVNAKSNSLLVLLRGPAGATVPACVHLWALKGSAHPERRRAEHLRTAMAMHNRMLGFVHCPDEPADLVRELGILLPLEELRPLLLACIPGCGGDPVPDGALGQKVTELESSSERHSVDPAEVLRRLTHQDEVSIAAELAWAVERGAQLPLDVVRSALCAARIDLDSWDGLTLSAELIKHDRAGASPILDARSVDDVLQTWKSQGAAIRGSLREVFHG